MRHCYPPGDPLLPYGQFTLCRTQRRVAHMCSSTVSDTANRLRKTRKKKSSVVPPFRSGHMSVICARLGSKGKVGVQRGRKTAGCPSFLPPPRVRRRPRRGARHAPAVRRRRIPAEVQRKTPRPVRANTLTQFAHPAGSAQKIREIPKKFSLPKRQKNAHSHAEKTPIRMTKLAKPNRAESGRKFLSKKCLTYWLGYANLYTWLAEAY